MRAWNLSVGVKRMRGIHTILLIRFYTEDCTPFCDLFCSYGYAVYRVSLHQNSERFIPY